MKRKNITPKKSSAMEREFEIRKKHRLNSPEALNARIDVHLELISELERELRGADEKKKPKLKSAIEQQKSQIRAIRKYLERKK